MILCSTEDTENTEIFIEKIEELAACKYLHADFLRVFRAYIFFASPKN